jgi:hypothetical protein
MISNIPMAKGEKPSSPLVPKIGLQVHSSLISKTARKSECPQQRKEINRMLLSLAVPSNLFKSYRIHVKKHPILRLAALNNL